MTARLANGSIRVGTSGWIYKHWRGLFYPADLPPRLWLRHYTDHFDTVEINNSFYRLPSDKAFDFWRGKRRRRSCMRLKRADF